MRSIHHRIGIVSIPGDISLVGYDDIPDAQRQAPPLTTIRIPSMDEGKRAVQVLFDLIENRKLYSNEVILPVHLVSKNSTGVSSQRALALVPAQFTQ